MAKKQGGEKSTAADGVHPEDGEQGQLGLQDSVGNDSSEAGLVDEPELPAAPITEDENGNEVVGEETPQPEAQLEQEPGKQSELTQQPETESEFNISQWLESLHIETYPKIDSLRGKHTMIYSRKLERPLGTVFQVPDGSGVDGSVLYALALPGKEPWSENNRKLNWSGETKLDPDGHQVFFDEGEVVQALSVLVPA